MNVTPFVVVLGPPDSADKYSGSREAKRRGVPVFYIEEVAAEIGIELTMPPPSPPNGRGGLGARQGAPERASGGAGRGGRGAGARAGGRGCGRGRGGQGQRQRQGHGGGASEAQIMQNLSDEGLRLFDEAAKFLLPAAPAGTPTPACVIMAAAHYGNTCHGCGKHGTLQPWLKFPGQPRVGCVSFRCCRGGCIMVHAAVKARAQAFARDHESPHDAGVGGAAAEDIVDLTGED